MEFLFGLVLALLTLRDVFDTVVVPGESRGSLRIARRLIFATLPLWRLARGRKPGISTGFAPFALFGAFLIWMILLALAFGLMTHGLRNDFRPVLPSFSQALYVAGSGLVTLGLSETDATGPARWVLLAAGFCGLAVMTMAVTYLLEVQTSTGRRDAGILKLTTSAGKPPSALGLLERYAELGFLDQIPQVLHDGRDWCASVLQSHAAHPTLIYFRSTGAAVGWPATVGALMDLSLAVECLLDMPQWRGPAILLREEATRLAVTLITLIGLKDTPSPPSKAEVEALLSRLRAAGCATRAAPDYERFIAQRGRHAGWVSSLAAHLGTPDAPLIPPAQLRAVADDDRPRAR